MTSSERLILANSKKNNIPSLATGNLLHYCFSDVDELAGSRPDVKALEITQLDLQPFRCNAMTLQFGMVVVSFSRANCPVKTFGNKVHKYLSFVCLPHGSTRPVVSHGKAITHDFVYGFDLNREVNQIFPAHTTHCSINIHQDVFEACAQAMDRPDLNARYFTSNFLYMPEGLAPLRAYLQQLYHLMKQRSPLVQRPDFQQILLQDLVPLLIATLPLQQDGLKVPVRAFQRSSLVSQAEAYMQAHLDQPLTLADLCKALGTSSRALSYGFQDIFGISPMAYLKILRLMGVHRALKAANPQHTTVISIAAQFGFWSMGHFARDYKQMFGKSPQEVLKRR
jgi:AraC family transcriptional regulator, ethanolamine operon transcriptional activator